MPTPLLCFGEALWDLLPDGSVLGGAPLNLTYRLDSQGSRSAIISSLGSDELGGKARAQIVDYGLDTRFLYQHSERPTGTVEVLFDEKREPSYRIVPEVAYDEIPVTDELVDAAGTAPCFCFGTLAQRDSKSRKTLYHLLGERPGKLNLLDLNLRPLCYSREIVDYSLSHAGILKINEDEARTLKEWYGLKDSDYRQLAASLCRHFDLELCILTLGPKGACIGSPAGPVCAEPSYDVPKVDPCGAGDAFTAGFLAGFLNGMAIPDACRRGNALGSAVTGHRGALQKIADEEVVELEMNGIPYQFQDSDFIIESEGEN